MLDIFSMWSLLGFHGSRSGWGEVGDDDSSHSELEKEADDQATLALFELRTCLSVSSRLSARPLFSLLPLIDPILPRLTFFPFSLSDLLRIDESAPEQYGLCESTAN